MSASKYIARSCKDVNKAFMECKAKDLNPSACLKEGEAVTECLLKLLKRLHTEAPEEFNSYVKCMDYHSNNLEKCRKEQAILEEKCPE